MLDVSILGPGDAVYIRGRYIYVNPNWLRRRWWKFIDWLASDPFRKKKALYITAIDEETKTITLGEKN